MTFYGGAMSLHEVSLSNFRLRCVMTDRQTNAGENIHFGPAGRSDHAFESISL